MKVIVCVDYSAHTERILQVAKTLLGTRVPQPDIVVMHIIDITVLAGAPGNEQQVTGELLDEGKKIVELATTYFDGNFQYVEDTGVPQAKIDELLKTYDYDLLVIGTRGRSMLTTVLLGSVAEHLLHHTQKPLLIVP